MTRPMELRTLHFALSFLAAGQPACLHVGRRRHNLIRHTPATLAMARKVNRAVSMLPDHQVTHHVPDIELPADAAQLLFVTTPSKVPGAKLPTILLTKIHTPKATY